MSGQGKYNYSAIFLTSFSLMMFELVLTRLFSVKFDYHFVYLILSLSVMSIGLGGMALKKWYQIFPMNDLPVNVAMTSFTSLILILVLIFDPVKALGFGGTFSEWIYIAAAAVPFFFFGLVMAGVFQKFPHKSSMVYAFDIFGAAIATLVTIPILNQFSVVNVAFLASIILALASLLFSVPARDWKISSGFSIVLVLIAAIGVNIFMEKPVLQVAENANKDLLRFINNPYEKGKIIDSRWSAFGRTDLVRGKQGSGYLSMFVDGAAGSAMYNWREIQADSLKSVHLRYHFGEFFPFYFLTESEKDSAFIIGPGGGRDVVVALLGGVKHITAVEVNPQIVQIMNDYAEYNGGLYRDYPNVNVVVADARNYLRKSNLKYDLIMASIPITKSSRSIEGYSLTENFLFTVEAISEYVDHLTSEGRIVIVAHNDAEIYRLIMMVIEYFNEKGIDPSLSMNHIYTIASGMMPTLVIKKTPFRVEETQARHQLMHKLGFVNGNFFLPYRQAPEIRPASLLGLDLPWRMFDQVLVALYNGQVTPEEVRQAASFDIGAVHDDKPFFYKFQKGLPAPFGVFFLIIVLVFFLLLYMTAIKGNPEKYSFSLFKSVALHPELKWFYLIFFSSGAGFMLLEIASLQKLNIFTDNPLEAISVLLFSLLLGTGTGSFLSNFIKENKFKTISLVSLAIAVVSVALSKLIPAVYQANDSIFITSMVTILPLGILLGIPFPAAMNKLSAMNLSEYIYLCWGINGIAAITGSVLAMIIGILFGFTFALWTAAVFYILISLGFFKISIHSKAFHLNLNK